MDETNNLRIGIVILAAGSSSRLGKPKQLLKFRGKSLILRAAETALETASEKVTVVLGANCELVKKQIEHLPLEIAVNENWASGMSSSIKTGLEKLLEAEPNLSAAIVMLCDQPLIDGAVLTRLIEVYKRTQAKIVASEYTNTTGVPALFANSMFTELLNLQAQSGARRLIEKYSAYVGKIRVPEAEIDVDTLTDYEKLIAKDF